MSLVCMASVVYAPGFFVTVVAEEETALAEVDATVSENVEAVEETIPAGEELQMTLPEADPAAEAGDGVAAEEAVNAETNSGDLFVEFLGNDYEDEELFDQFDEFLEEESEEEFLEEEPLSEGEADLHGGPACPEYLGCLDIEIIDGLGAKYS